MRLAILSIALFTLMFQSVKGQNFLAASKADFLLNSKAVYSGNDPSEIKPPAVYAPKVAEEGNSILFGWNAIEQPINFNVTYELNIYSEEDDKTALFWMPLYETSYTLEEPSRFLNSGTKYFVQINSRLSGSDKSYSIKGQKKAFEYSFIPHCTTPKNVRVEEIGPDFVILEWEGAEASPDGVQYEIRMKTVDEFKESKETVYSSIVSKGLSNKMEALEKGKSYLIEIRKICNRKEAETSKWVQLNYNHQNRLISLPLFVCGEPFLLPDFDTLPEMCIDHAVYGLPADSVLYIGGFPIFYDWLEYDNCETYNVPVVEVYDVPIDTIMDTTYCQIPDTFCQTYYFGYELIHVGDTICCYRLDDNGGRIYGSCEPVNEWDEVFEDLCPVYDTIHDYENICDTIGWTTEACDITQTIIYETVTDTVDWEQYTCECTYNGEGVVPLPFGKERVRVAFEGVKVRVELLPFGQKRHHIYNKNVYGLFDDQGLYPNFKTAPPATLGEYCRDPQWREDGTHVETDQPWDPDGFGQDGLYKKEPPYPGYEQGDLIDTTGQWDPNGFNSNGEHISGGNANEYGCTQDQLNSNEPQPPCDSLPPPYYWLDTTGTSPPSQAGILFEQQVRDSLANWVTNALNELATNFQDTINGLPSCDSIRTVMRTKVVALGYDSTFIFGPEGEFIEVGMYKNFNKRPEGISATRFSPRDANTIALEESHTALYDCDKGIAIYNQLLSTIAEHQTSGKIQEIVDNLSEQIRRLSESEVAELSDPLKMAEWILIKVEEIIRAANTATYGGISSLESNNSVQGAWAAVVDDRNQSPGVFIGGYSADPLANYGINQTELDEIINSATEEMKSKWAINGDFDWKPVLNPSELPEMILTNRNPELLPIELKRSILSKTYTIYLDSIYFTPEDGAYLDAYTSIVHKGNRYVFSAQNVQFMPTGLPSGSGRLQLDNDIEIPISNPALLRIKGNERTYVAWSCHGFDGMSIDAEIEFCRKYIVPYDTDTKKPIDNEEIKVTASFLTQMPAWGEFYAKVDFDHSFAVTKAQNVVWTVDSAFFDFSSRVSATGISLPQGYTSPHMHGNKLSESWKGFYLKNLQATVTPKFTGEGSTPRTIGVSNMVIDGRGFSGELFIEPVLPLSEGSMNGWAFSIERLDLTIIHNQFAGGGFNGLINVPLFSNKKTPTGAIIDKDCFTYQALFQPDNKYLIGVKMPDNDLKVPMWKAGYVTIDSVSSVHITYDEETGFDALATLTGEVAISAEITDSLILSLPKIAFQEVKLSNKPDYIKSAGKWQLPDVPGADFGGFEFSLDTVKIGKTTEGEPAMFLKAGLQLGEERDNIHLNARGGFTMLGELEMVGEHQRFISKELKVNTINLNGSFPGVPKITGFLKHYGSDPDDPPQYGTGFRGGVHIEMEALMGASFTSVGQFGRVDGYKYFFVDVLTCIDVPMGGLTLKGAGGGVTYHMAKDSIVNQGLLCNGSDPIIDEDAIGESLTGAYYSPDDSYGIGLKLTVALATSDETAFNGNATLEVLFNATDSLGCGGGLATIDLYGNCKFMAELDLGAPPTYDSTGNAIPNNDAQIKGFFKLTVNFNDRYFDGNFEADIATSNGVMTGKGEVNVHISEQKWYFRAGRPRPAGNPIYLNLNLPKLGNIATVETYLQIGSEIDDMPPLPLEVRTLTGATDATERKVELEKLKGNREWSISGSSGFGFGMNVMAGDRKKDFNFLIFYSRLGLDFGFDVGIRKENSGLTCAQTNEPPGINGWYAEGQAWAILEAALGIRVKVFKKTRRFELASLTGAMALQAKLPNPFWMEGAVGVEYNVMGGLVSGKAKFKFQIGELCDYDVTTAGDITLIQSTYPEDGYEAQFPVDDNPSVTFRFPMDKTIEIRDDNETLEFDPEIEFVKLYYKEINPSYQICADGELSADGTTYVLTPCYMLPGNDTFKIHIRARIDEGGVTGPVQDSIVTFVTGPALDYIPPANIVGSYPVSGQYNFYKEEIQGRTGYIQLAKGQPELLANYETEIYARFTDTQENTTEVKTSYAALEEKLEFPIPSDWMQNNVMYKVEFIEKEGSSGLILGGTQSVGPFASGDKEIYSMYFRSSQYNTFSDKITAMSTTITNVGPSGVPDMLPASIDFSLPEPFDQNEISNLIKMDKERDNLPVGSKLLTQPDESKYLGMYFKYPIGKTECTCNITNLNPIPEDFRGVSFNKPKPPTDQIYIRTDGADLNDFVVTEEMFNSSILPIWQGTEQWLDVKVFDQYGSDYRYLKALFNSSKNDLELQYRSYIIDIQNGVEIKANADDRYLLAKYCIEEKTAINYSFFEYPPPLPDGAFGFPIYLKYSLPAYNFDPYSIIQLNIPAR